MTLEELLEECKKHGLSVNRNIENKFNVFVRYDRGLGPEYAILGQVKAITIKHAYELAQKEAEKLLDQPGMEKAVIKEVKIEP